jgi:DNA-binding CsgD family transcriptional regulator
MALSILYIITLLSAAYSLGGLTNLLLMRRTAVLRTMLLFLLSLFMVAMSFFVTNAAGDSPGFATLAWLFSLSGIGLNIAVLPALVSSLTALPQSRAFAFAHGIWTATFIILGILFFLLPPSSDLQGLVQAVLLTMQLSSIAAAILVMALRVPRMRRSWWYPGLIGFIILSGAFLAFLALDMLISLIPIPVLAPVDGFSLPAYLIALNLGALFFSSRYLSRDALVVDDRLSDDCIAFYQLTPRETEISSQVLAGLSNRDIGEKLFISPKTVENHLYNIYQKFDVGSRTQLIHLLQTWRRE